MAAFLDAAKGQFDPGPRTIGVDEDLPDWRRSPLASGGRRQKSRRRPPDRSRFRSPGGWRPLRPRKVAPTEPDRKRPRRRNRWRAARGEQHRLGVVAASGKPRGELPFGKRSNPVGNRTRWMKPLTRLSCAALMAGPQSRSIDELPPSTSRRRPPGARETDGQSLRRPEPGCPRRRSDRHFRRSPCGWSNQAKSDGPVQRRSQDVLARREFKNAPRIVLGRRLLHQLADLRRAGEGNEITTRMRGERGASQCRPGRSRR